MKITPFFCRFLSFGLPVFLVVGCATTRPRTAAPKESHPAVSHETAVVLEDSTTTAPQPPLNRQVYALFRQAFKALQAGRRLHAAVSLDSAAVVLTTLLSEHADSLSARSSLVPDTDSLSTRSSPTPDSLSARSFPAPGTDSLSTRSSLAPDSLSARSFRVPDSLSARRSDRSKTPDTLSTKRLSGLVLVALELYRELLPKTVPLSPGTPLVRMLNALPPAVVASVKTHPYYREFYIRKLAGTADVPVDYTPQVLQSIHFFQTDAREYFETWLSRSGRYLPMIRKIFAANGVPQDLAYLAMVESGFNPKAYSRARAAGLWQFTRYTAPLYELHYDTWVDERRDPEKSTRAAARHIQHLYELFGDWRLVVAAYNCGQGRLDRAIREDGTRNFWKLHNLPRETRRHVPRFMAALLISKDPAFFGFDNVSPEEPLNCDIVPVTECVDLKVAAECADTTYEWMLQANPELRWGYTPPPAVRKIYPLRVPAGSAARFRLRYDRLPNSRKIRMVVYRVHYGDTISQIAHRLETSAQAILDANGIRNPRHLRAGYRLKIPIRPNHYARAQDVAETQLDTDPDPTRQKRVVYRVHKGDTIWDIAQREGVDPEEIQAWNGLHASQSIFPGDRLTIWKPRDPSGPTEGQQQADRPSGSFYTVKPGDTLWDIARTFQTSVRDLKKWNEIRHSSHIRAGDKILVRPADDSQTD